MNVLVTGHAGFIGFHVARAALARGDTVVGVDVVNDYYDVALKRARLAELTLAAKTAAGAYTSIEADLAQPQVAAEAIQAHDITHVIHLAAQAGVRHSLSHPLEYVHSNLIAFTHLLEACRHAQVTHLSYASTSSVYGANTTMPFSEAHGANHPLQFYAATKRANELMAHSYSHLYGLPCTGLRFFTVYGPWGRPDMAPFKFIKAVLEGQTISLYNHGDHSRDFTYIDDIVAGVLGASDRPAQPNPGWNASAPSPASSNAPWRILNIGNNAPVHLMDFLRAIEQATGCQAHTESLPLQPGDVKDTYADSSALAAVTGVRPRVGVEQGVTNMVAWYRQFYGV